MIPELDPVLRAMLDIATRTADLVREQKARGFEVFYKGPNDPVTSVDRAANDALCSALSRGFPDSPIVAEESDPQTYEGFERAERAFFVDPIDGTREFISGSDDYVIMIGLTVNGQPELGVVVAPARRISWFAQVGRGAFREQGGETEWIAASDVSALDVATLLAPYPSEDGKLDPAFAKLPVGKVQSVGSAGLKGSWVAEGRGDVYLSPGRSGKRWDACAIDALLKASGGTLTDTNGAHLDYRRQNLDNESGLLATNGLLHPFVVAALAAR